jgi:hypothetical protein
VRSFSRAWRGEWSTERVGIISAGFREDLRCITLHNPVRSGTLCILFIIMQVPLALNNLAIYTEREGFPHIGPQIPLWPLLPLSLLNP